MDTGSHNIRLNPIIAGRATRRKAGDVVGVGSVGIAAAVGNTVIAHVFGCAYRYYIFGRAGRTNAANPTSGVPSGENMQHLLVAGHAAGSVAGKCIISLVVAVVSPGCIGTPTIRGNTRPGIIGVGDYSAQITPAIGFVVLWTGDIGENFCSGDAAIGRDTQAQPIAVCVLIRETRAVIISGDDTRVDVAVSGLAVCQIVVSTIVVENYPRRVSG